MIKFFVVGMLFLSWLVLISEKTPCSCEQASVPQNYFFVESVAEEMCINDERETIVARVVRQGKVKYE